MKWELVSRAGLRSDRQRIREIMSVIIQSLFAILSGHIYICPLPIIIMFHDGNARLVYDVLRVASFVQGAFPFSSTPSTNTLGKGMNPITLPPAMGK